MTNGHTLSVRDLVGYAIGSIFRHFGTLIALCAPAFLLIVAAAVYGRLSAPPPTAADGMEAMQAGGVGILLVVSIFAGLLMIPAFTGWHRLLVTGSVRREDGTVIGWDRREWRYLGLTVLIWALMTLTNIGANVVVGLTGGSAAVAVLVTIAAFAIYLAIWSKVGMNLPAAALGDPRSRADIADLVGEEAGRVAMGLAGVWLVLIFGGTLVIMALSFVVAAIGGGLYIFFVLAIMLYYLAWIAMVGVLSRAYQLLSEAAGPVAPDRYDEI